jgi:hypothetical protein
MQAANTEMNFPGRNQEEANRSEMNEDSAEMETTAGDLQDEITGEPVLDEEDMEENDLEEEDLDDIEWEESEGEDEAERGT